MRRYFDEYRGLHETTGHVEPFGLLSAARQVGAAVAGDRRWMAEQRMSAAEQARWSARATVHHGGRRVFSALGSRAGRIPGPVRERLSLEGRSGAGAAGNGGPPSARVRPSARRCRPPADPPQAFG